MKQLINKTTIKYIKHIVNVSENKMNTSRLRALGRKSFVLACSHEEFHKFVTITLLMITLKNLPENDVNRWQEFILIGECHTHLFLWKTGYTECTYMYSGKPNTQSNTRSINPLQVVKKNSGNASYSLKIRDIYLPDSI